MPFTVDAGVQHQQLTFCRSTDLRCTGSRPSCSGRSHTAVLQPASPQVSWNMCCPSGSLGRGWASSFGCSEKPSPSSCTAHNCHGKSFGCCNCNSGCNHSSRASYTAPLTAPSFTQAF